MKRACSLFALTTMLLLSACGKGTTLDVSNSTKRVVGHINMQDQHTATIVNASGDVRGRVRGNIVRDDSGKHVGTITERNGHVVIVDAADNPIGSFENGTDCYGKSQDVLGHVSKEADPQIAAGACLIFFLQ